MVLSALGDFADWPMAGVIFTVSQCGRCFDLKFHKNGHEVGKVRENHVLRLLI
jgi:hypothetical protein